MTTRSVRHRCRPTAGRAVVRVVVRVVVMTVVVAGAVGCASAGEPIRAAARPATEVAARPVSGVHPNRSLVADGGQFLVTCALSHQANDDPIMHRDHPGHSHGHDFFGNISTDASSTATSLLAAPTTCSDARDHSAYWVPALQVDGQRIDPRRIDAYYRVAHGVAPAEVQPYPEGLEIVAGDQFAAEPAPLTVAAWACGSAPTVASAPPTTCTDDRPVQLRLTFASCWDGGRLTHDAARPHVEYPSTDGGCPATYPVALPQLTLTVHYPLAGDFAEAKLASGGFATTHGDFLAAWDPDRIAAQVSGCLARSVTCGLVGGTFHTGPGAGDTAGYHQRGVPADRHGWADPPDRE